ncbi:MAG TPA: hypothetical protein PKL00_10095 [Bacillota bacterium]|nr:hypothetical protein [Bacillota bacterium]
MSNNLIQLKDYEGKCNVLIPTVTMQQISPFHRIRVEQVKIDPNPESGDVFKVGGKKVGNKWEDVLSLSKTAIMKLSQAAGIVWNWQETRPISVSKDYVLYQAVGAMRKPSGEWIPLKATKEIDLEVIEAETYEANLETAKKLKPDQRDGLTPEQWAAAKTKKNMLQWRKNKLMRAETGAMLRVVRALLSVKHQYTPAELEKPFAVPTVDFAPDYSDPEVRKAMAEAGVRATADLFGTSAVHQLQAPQQQMPPAIDVDQYSLEDAGDDLSASIADEPEPEQVANDDLPPWDDEPAQQEIFADAVEAEGIVCQGCDQLIETSNNWSPEKIAEYSKKIYGKALCVDCQKKAAKQKAGARK